MPYTGQEDHSISLSDAIAMTANYRNSASGSSPFLGGYFGKTSIEAILGQQGCVGIRIYNAKAASGASNYVIVGVNSSGEDMEDDNLAEHGVGCPPFCASHSKLAGTA
jgi:hypothetical protein